MINWTDINNMTGVLQSANSATNNSFWTGMLFMIFVVLILIFIGYGLEASLLVSSFICLILGVLMVYLDLVAWQTLLIFLGIILTMFLYIIFTSNKVRQ